MKKIFLLFLLMLLPLMASADGNASQNEERKAYAVLSDNNTVLTFYYDDQKTARNGMDVGPFTSSYDYDNQRSNVSSGWDTQRESITSVVFDDSFAGCTTLTSTAYWFYQLENVSSITGIDNLKTDNVTDMRCMFSGCSSLTNLDVTGFKTDNVTYMRQMFAYCSGLTSLDVTGFKTDNVTDMIQMFCWCSGLTSLDVTGFKTDKVTDMESMFYGCSGLTSLDVTGFRTDNVTDMYGMFGGCSGLKSLDVTGFRTDNVTDMYGMFRGCSGLKSLDLSGFNTMNVKSMGSMFEGCSGLKTIYAGDGWSTAKVQKVQYGRAMFESCMRLVGGAGTYYDGNQTDHSYAHIDGGASNPGYFTDKNAMPVEGADNQGYAIFDESTGVLTFKYGEKPEGENVYDTDTPIDDDRVSFWLEDSWFSKRGYIKKVVIEESFENVRPVSTRFWFYNQHELEEIVGLNHINGSDLICMKSMFSGCSKLTNIDLSGLRTDHVTDMSNLFEHCSFSSLNLSCLNTENVTNMNSMFCACRELSSINLTGFKTDKVTDMSQMFDACSNLQEIDLSSFNTENVTDMSHMFAFCDLIISLDLRSFNTVNVTTMEGMFMYCSNLVNLDISSFRTGKVENLSGMFSSCKKLTSLDLSHFNTENVSTMSGLFSGCEKLQKIDISSFNTQKVTDMSYMFSKCYSLEAFDIHHFNTSNVTDFEGMFYYCSSIENIDLSNFDTHNMTKITSLFDHCSKLTEVDLTNFDTRNLTEYGYVFQACRKLEIVKFGKNFSTAKVSGKYVNWGFQNCFELKEIWINGDVPELLSTTFGRVGDFGTVILRVPEQYKQNYADHFVDGTFGGGSFVLDVLSDNGSESSIPPSIPDFGTKRLKKITWTDGKETEMAELRYDDTGRIKEYLIDGKIINQYTYSDNTISISENGDSYEYNISDGRVASGKTILDGDNVEIDRTFIYNNQAQLISIVNKEREMGNPGTNVISEKWEWSGDNLTSWSEDAWGDTETSSITYNDITAEPMVRALFGFSQARHLDDFYEILAIYPYLGSIPKNLFQTVKHKDAEKRDFEYNYTYEQKSNGEIGKVSISYKDKTYVFTLDWEDSGASEKDPSEDVIKITSAGQSTWCSKYNLDFTGVDGLKAYIATGFDKDEEIIWLTRVKDVPAGTPVLVKGEANQTYQVPVTDSKNSYYENLFKGNTSGATIQVNETEGDKVNYYLSGDGTFKSVKGYANIGNNKSYLQLPGTFAPAEAGTTQTVKVGSAGKASFAAPVDLDFTNVDGLKAFTATGYDKSSKTIWLTRVMKVQKGEGVLLKGEAKDYEIPSVAVQSSYMNMFVGNTSGASVQVQATSEDGSQTNFYLKGDGTFVSVNGYVNIGNNKCYLELPTSMVAGGASTRGAEANYLLEEPEVIKLPISFRSLDNDGDGTTAIRETKQLRDDGAYYTLQGQRVMNPGKGLYIKNGKKIVIK